MESENGVSVEDEKRLVVDNSNSEGSSSVDVNKENMNGGENEVCEDEIKDKEALNPSGPQLEISTAVSKAKTSNAKNSNGSSKKSSKLGKNQPDSKGSSVAFGRSRKPSLSQSMSFPARGRLSDPMKRSIEVSPAKAEPVQQPRRNGVKDEAKVGSGLNFRGVVKGGKAAGGRRATLGSLPSVSQSMVRFFCIFECGIVVCFDVFVVSVLIGGLNSVREGVVW